MDMNINFKIVFVFSFRDVSEALDRIALAKTLKAINVWEIREGNGTKLCRTTTQALSMFNCLQGLQI